MRRRRILAVLMVAAVLAVWVIVPAPDRQSAPASPPLATSKPAPAGPARPPVAAEAVRAADLRHPRIPAGSLEGSQVDGDIVVDAAGRLQPDLALRHRFDYYLTLVGEVPLARIRQRLQQSLLQGQLPAAARQEVMADFDRYVRLQRASAGMAAAAGGGLGDQLAALHHLRADILGQKLFTAFYAADMDREHADLERLRIASDPRWSRQQRQARLDAMEQSAQAADPALAQQQTASLVEQMTTQLDQAQADPATRHALRAAAWGDAAADRLAALDQQRLQWQQRLDRYRQRCAEIMHDAALSPIQRQAALDDLRRAGFTEQEQRRLPLEAAAVVGDG